MRNKRILTLITLLLFLLLLVGCKAINQAPIITSIPITAVELGETYTYDVNATDPEGDTLAYSLITKPAGMTITSTTGLIKWTPKAEGNFAVAVKVSDGVLYIIQSFTIVVSKLPDPPAPPPIVNYAPIITSIPGDTAITGVVYLYDVNATDPNGDVLTYSLNLKPKGMTINSATGLVKWTPTKKGDYAVIVKVSDGEKATTQSFTIVVSEVSPPPVVNHAPIINSIPVTVATVKIGYVYNVIATDPDGDTLTYSLITYPTGMTIKSATGVISWTPASGQIGANAVIVKVSDGKKATTQSFTITVSAVEPGPEPNLTGIEVSPDAMILLKGDSQQLTVTAHYSDGSTADITSDCIYASSDSDIASVGVYGLIMAMGFGKSTIHVSATPNGIVLTDIVEVIVGPVHNVTQDFYRNTIQAAIDDSSTLVGDTIEVMAGTYNLNLPISVDKALTLTGDTTTPSNVVINAPTTGSDRDCFQVQVSNVIIQGFRMQNSYDWGSGTDGGENGGVMIGNNSSNTIMFEPGLIRDLSHVTVAHCEFDNCSYGVYVYEAGDNITIDYNVLTGVWRPVIFYGWEVEWLQTCDNSISNNTMDGFGYPFYVNRGGYSPDGSEENRGIEFGHAPFGNEFTIDVQGLSITHNEISNYIRHAVILSVSGQYGTFNGAIDISYNTITHTAVDVTPRQGRHTVEVYGDYVKFSHNTVIDHAWNAFAGLNSHHEVHDNIISNTVPQYDAGHVAAITVGNDAEVYNNNLSGGLTGITLYGDRINVYDNTISDYTSTSSDGNGGNGIFLYSDFATDTINIYDNDISGCLIGIRDEAAPTGLNINSNNIYGNINYGVSTIADLPIDAENNWWGIGGTGDNAGSPGEDDNNGVSANVDYIPWSTSEFN